MEENPFENPATAQLWDTSVEGEKGQFRDNHIYPLVREWLALCNPATVLDIGCGQGVAAPLCEGRTYVGVEPSAPLVEIARERYSEYGTFHVGSAYALPVEDRVFDAVFSINVWFHLGDLDTAARELSRVLKAGGQFLIITANPDAYDAWEGFFGAHERTDDAIIGAFELPLVTLPRSIVYTHTEEAVLASLQNAGARVRESRVFGERLFRAYFGGKKSE